MQGGTGESPNAAAGAKDPAEGVEPVFEDGGANAEPIEAALEDLIAALAEHWRKHGADAFDLALDKDPVRYLALVAKLLPDLAAEAAAKRSAEEPGAGESLVALLASFDGAEDDGKKRRRGRLHRSPAPAMRPRHKDAGGPAGKRRAKRKND